MGHSVFYVTSDISVYGQIGSLFRIMYVPMPLNLLQCFCH